MLRQRNVHKDSSLGEQVLEHSFTTISADEGSSIYLSDVEKVEITEVGGYLTAITGGGIDPEVYFEDDAGDPDAQTDGTLVYSAAGGTYNLDSANEAKSNRMNAEFDCPQQTIVDTDKKGAILRITANETGTLTGATGKLWVRFRPYRAEDL